MSAKEAAGLSVRELARRVGVSHVTMGRLLRGEPRVTTVDLVARAAEVVGLQLAASLYPNGDPVRDRAHLALLARFKARLHGAIGWRPEVPIPIAGDRRSGDALIGRPNWDALVEAETRLADIQLIERKASAKQRDLGATRLILLVSDTRNNREVLRLHPELRERFPIDTRACLGRLARGEDPGADAMVIL
jgi:transcriptional regulator with XRE-family HTH domain